MEDETTSVIVHDSRERTYAEMTIYGYNVLTINGRDNKDRNGTNIPSRYSIVCKACDWDYANKRLKNVNTIPTASAMHNATPLNRSGEVEHPPILEDVGDVVDLDTTATATTITSDFFTKKRKDK